MGNSQMDLKTLHAWDVTPHDAVTLQKSLAAQIDHQTPLPLSSIRLVAGVDVSVKENVSQAAVVIATFPEMQVVETIRVKMPTPFPYIPGLLTFREGPVLVKAFEQLQRVPDVFIFDGMGRIHPRRIGIASHMGLWLDKPTLGCGKTHFLGTYDEPPAEKGTYSPLTDRGELLGVVLRTRDNVKPVYISPGHKIDLDSAVQITMACTDKYRLPTPIRLAHGAAGEYGE